MKIGMITDSLPDTDFDTLVATAGRLGLGIRKLCLELYGHQNVYNVRTLQQLRAAVGYDDVLSIEHEDPTLPALEGVEKSVAFLRNVLNELPRARDAAQ